MTESESPPSPRQRVRAGLEAVRARIAEAASLAGRSPDEVRLVVVTKSRGLDEVEAVMREGISDLGENRVAEAYAKWVALKERLGDHGRDQKGVESHDSRKGLRPTVHLVGHLQRNKVSKALTFVDYLHSLDSLPLAKAIAKRLASGELEQKVAALEGARVEEEATGEATWAPGRSKTPRRAPGSSSTLQVLVEVNVTGEPQKHGIAPDATCSFVEQVLEVGLRPIGLMCMSRFGAPPDCHVRNFEKLAAIRDEVIERVHSTVTELSMGMTDDFEEAIACGSTMVRIGRAIFEPQTS